jgi:mono/diheme cytochrome c family protein
VVRHPFWQAVGLVVLAYLVFTFGLAYVPPLVGIPSAPVPRSVVVQYMLTALVGILLFVSHSEERWVRFKQPIASALVDRDKRWLRGGLLALVPLLVGVVTFRQTRPTVPAPVTLRSIHPAPPARITVRGTAFELNGLENPLRSQGSLEEHVRTGRRVYYQNCLPCHGDLLNGQGHFGHGFSPTPLAFPENLPLLTESFVFWRIAKGGPGLPKEGAPWNSAMPVWEDYLTADEIWAVVIFLFEQTGTHPRRWEAGAEGSGHE